MGLRRNLLDRPARVERGDLSVSRARCGGLSHRWPSGAINPLESKSFALRVVGAAWRVARTRAFGSAFWVVIDGVLTDWDLHVVKANTHVSDAVAHGLEVDELHH